MCRLLEHCSTSVVIANTVGVSQMESQKARMKKKKSYIHLARDTFWWRTADLFTRPGHCFCIICELNNGRIKERGFNLFAKMLIISRTHGRVRLPVRFCCFFSYNFCCLYCPTARIATCFNSALCKMWTSCIWKLTIIIDRRIFSFIIDQFCWPGFY